MSKNTASAKPMVEEAPAVEAPAVEEATAPPVQEKLRLVAIGRKAKSGEPRFELHYTADEADHVMSGLIDDTGQTYGRFVIPIHLTGKGHSGVNASAKTFMLALCREAVKAGHHDLRQYLMAIVAKTINATPPTGSAASSVNVAEVADVEL
jgi:hypothetical protein